MNRFLLLPFLCILFSNTSYSQSLSQEVIGSTGEHYTNNDKHVTWTLGEVMVETYSLANKHLTQGFHQPMYKRNVIEDEYEFYNGFSPNGDGKNDFWKIPFLINYPLNKVSIINRWGDVVWSGLNYNNTEVRFEGKNMNHIDLPDGTYYFTIEYAVYVKSGWVFIKR